MPPGGLPDAFLEGGPSSLRQLAARASRGPRAVHDRRGGDALRPRRRARCSPALEREERLVRGELRPGGTEREWCDPDVLRRLRRASLAALARGRAGRAGRARPLPARLARHRPARDAARGARARCRRSPCPVALWETEVLPRRVPGYRPELLDQLCATGEVVWVGAGLDRVAVYFREDAALLGRPPARRRPRAERTTRSARRSAAAPSSGSTSSPRPGSRPRRRCPRSGSSSGRAR